MKRAEKRHMALLKRVAELEAALVEADKAMVESGLSERLRERVVLAIREGCACFGPHLPGCKNAELLRTIGGEKERQRQVDLAHEAATPKRIGFSEAWMAAFANGQFSAANPMYVSRRTMQALQEQIDTISNTRE